MGRSLFLLAVIGFLMIITSDISAAAAPDLDSVHLEGEVWVTGSQRQPLLLLSADATDGSGYHLEAALSPTSPGDSRREREEDERPRQRRDRARSTETVLAGEFTLSGSGFSKVGGDATGRLDNSGAGTLRFTDAGTVQLSADFSVDGSGALAMDLSGRLPSASAASHSDTPAAARNPTQPVDHTFWYLVRAAGMSAYLMLFLNVVLGLAVRTRFMDALLARWRSNDLHQFTGLLAMGLLALHGLALLGDRYVGFTLPQILVPMASTYRPFWTALGIVAFYLIASVTASSYLRPHLGYRTWRLLHYLTFGAYLLALGHGILSGTDASQPWVQALYGSTGGVVLLLTLWRFGRGRLALPVSTRAGRATGDGR